MSRVDSALRDAIILHTTGLRKVFPTLADPVTVTGHATAWTKGSYSTIMAKASSPQTGKWTVDVVQVEALSVSDNYEIDLAYGDAGSEVVFASFRTKTQGYHQIPSFIFDSAARISARIASKSGGGDTADISIGYNIDPLQ